MLRLGVVYPYRVLLVSTVSHDLQWVTGHTLGECYAIQVLHPDTSLLHALLDHLDHPFTMMSSRITR